MSCAVAFARTRRSSYVCPSAVTIPPTSDQVCQETFAFGKVAVSESIIRAQSLFLLTPFPQGIACKWWTCAKSRGAPSRFGPDALSGGECIFT